MEKAAVGKHIVMEDVKDIVQHFKEDLEESELLTELKMVKNMYCEKIFSYSTLKEKIALYKSIFPQTSRLLQLLLVMPACYFCNHRTIIFFVAACENIYALQ